VTTLDHILELTAAIEARVGDGDWAGATGLDLERRRLLAEMFRVDPGSVPDAGAREVLQQLVARNEQTIARIHERRRTLMQEARQLGEGPTAVRAYEANSPSSAAATAWSPLT
jgi:hypothetical protein